VRQRLARSLLARSPYARQLDADAAAYLRAVETTDGGRLELLVRHAVNAFVLGCKADGTWSAIKACCILAGARTLSGALVPLVGAVPTNFNFVSGDYDRKTGLVGNGSTKYLDSNRNNNADPQNSAHLSVYVSTGPTDTTRRCLIGCGSGDAGSSQINTNSGSFEVRLRTATSTNTGVTAGATFVGVSRSVSTSYSLRANLTNTVITENSQVPLNANILVYRRGSSSPAYQNARLAFYSIGEFLDLALLDARVTTLINAFAAAIP
jgi:hypothetical protein